MYKYIYNIQPYIRIIYIKSRLYQVMKLVGSAGRYLTRHGLCIRLFRILYMLSDWE